MIQGFQHLTTETPLSPDQALERVIRHIYPKNIGLTDYNCWEEVKKAEDGTESIVHHTEVSYETTAG